MQSEADESVTRGHSVQQERKKERREREIFTMSTFNNFDKQATEFEGEIIFHFTADMELFTRLIASSLFFCILWLGWLGNGMLYVTSDYFTTFCE